METAERNNPGAQPPAAPNASAPQELGPGPPPPAGARSPFLTRPPPSSCPSCHLASAASIASRMGAPSRLPQRPSGSRSPRAALGPRRLPSGPRPRPMAPNESGAASRSPLPLARCPRPRAARPAPCGPPIHTKFGSRAEEGGGGPARPSSAPSRPDPGPGPRPSPYLIPAPV